MKIYSSLFHDSVRQKPTGKNRPAHFLKNPIKSRWLFLSVYLLALMAAPNFGLSIERISITPNGFPNDGESTFSSLSADGNMIAFYSSNSKLVPNDTNGQRDAFVYDRAAKTFERVSVATGGGQAHAAGGFEIKITPNGRYVLFTSTSPDLVTGDGNNAYDLFVHDRQTGITTRESISPTGGDGNHIFVKGDISADGRFVVFESDADNFGFTENNTSYDVFLRDRVLTTTTLISYSYGGAGQNDTPTGFSLEPSISDDGRFILFRSSAPDLVFGDNNGVPDVFLLDRQESLLSIVTSGSNCKISPDGAFAFITKIPSPPLPGESTSIIGLLAYPLGGGAIRRVALTPQGEPSLWGNGTSVDASNGRYVLFSGLVDDVVSGDANGKPDIYVHDLLTRRTARVSIGPGGVQAGQPCEKAAISQDGKWITFATISGSLAPPDIDGFKDVLLAANPLPKIYLAESLQRQVKVLQRKLKKARKRKSKSQTKKYARQIRVLKKRIRSI